MVTTSFHGTAFSIIFKRPFYTLRLGNQHDARSLSLLNRLSLTDRFVDGKEVEQLTAIDYKPVNACLEKEVIRSQAFLIEALQSRKIDIFPAEKYSNQTITNQPPIYIAYGWLVGGCSG